jgi:ATP-binding cassette, subfamily F, member 3
LLEPRNLLFLDEPTNHLDIPAAEILEEAITGFDGTVILVSHDRRFLESTTTRIVSVRDGRVDIYPAGFRDYAAAQAKPVTREPPPRAEPVKRAEPPTPEASGRAAFEEQKNRARMLEKKKKRVSELESAIAIGEEQLKILREELRQDPGGNWAKLAERAKEEQALAKKVETMMSEWSKLGEESA